MSERVEGKMNLKVVSVDHGLSRLRGDLNPSGLHCNITQDLPHEPHRLRNGEYLPEADAKVSIFDRGFLFADGVYEVTPIVNGRLVDYDARVERLTAPQGIAHGLALHGCRTPRHA